jgi:hypothetical protein
MSTPKQDEPHHGWSNTAELSFIENLASKKNAAALLRGYLTAHAKRTDFGSIDAKASGDLARQLLTRLENQAAIVDSLRAEVA